MIGLNEGCLTVGFEDDDGLRLYVALVKELAQLVPLLGHVHLLRVEVVLPEDHAVPLILQNRLCFVLVQGPGRSPSIQIFFELCLLVILPLLEEIVL